MFPDEIVCPRCGEVIQEILEIELRHATVFPLGAMGLGLSLELEIRQSFDDGNTMKDV
jgi:hypothetical protein